MTNDHDVSDYFSKEIKQLFDDMPEKTITIRHLVICGVSSANRIQERLGKIKSELLSMNDYNKLEDILFFVAQMRMIEDDLDIFRQKHLD